ncbi:hypothetical protein Caci_2989 [Catenulispora acidiphila DSM 44928]|uniref:Uncharacterized protein n=1 Tax=Catenulispora acidiphila (strain DSM 44928 / JCM 14897 / NBRC 102108 / NRRL B-24433 / ID139908) TaxID=479433 RepID=C7Q306_CATAD|nr:hypothetical protein [Catenulispora acidiphila]ACU71898.1 hypothetical protein Caci_2989 [Catenulispora acidiphila DSM 44928]
MANDPDYEAMLVIAAPQALAARAASIALGLRNAGDVPMDAVERLNNYVHALADRVRELEAQLGDAKGRIQAVRMVKVWHDDLGRGFVFSDELGHAVDPEIFPKPVPVRLDGGES